MVLMVPTMCPGVTKGSSSPGDSSHSADLLDLVSVVSSPSSGSFGTSGSVGCRGSSCLYSSIVIPGSHGSLSLLVSSQVYE